MSAHEHEQAMVLLAAWTVDACLPEEAAFVESHLARCAECAAEAASLRETAVVLAALVPPAVPPPSVKHGLLARIRGAQTVGPAAGSVTDAAAEAAGTVWPPLRTYQRMVQRLDDVLGNLHDADWARRAAADWTAQDLVSHLAAADEVLAGWLREPASPAGPKTSSPAGPKTSAPAARPLGEPATTGPAGDPSIAPATADPAKAPMGRAQESADEGILARLAANLDERSQAALDRSRGEPPELTRAYWRGQADDIVRRVVAGGARLSGRLMPFGGVPMPVEHVLLDRAFETWIHGDDIATTVGIAFAPPPPDHIHLMAQAAVGILPAVFVETGCVRRDAVAGLTLTGPGGGKWTVPFGPPDTVPRSTAIPAQRVADVRLDIIEFCLLVGGRREVATLAAEISGDLEAGRDVLVAAASLARP